MAIAYSLPKKKSGTIPKPTQYISIAQFPSTLYCIINPFRPHVKSAAVHIKYRIQSPPQKNPKRAYERLIFFSFNNIVTCGRENHYFLFYFVEGGKTPKSHIFVLINTRSAISYYMPQTTVRRPRVFH